MYKYIYIYTTNFRKISYTPNIKYVYIETYTTINRLSENKNIIVFCFFNERMNLTPYVKSKYVGWIYAWIVQIALCVSTDTFVHCAFIGFCPIFTDEGYLHWSSCNGTSCPNSSYRSDEVYKCKSNQTLSITWYFIDWCMKHKR